jgi:hypothetical protein
MALTKLLSRNRGLSSSGFSTRRAGRSPLDVGATDALDTETLALSAVSVVIDMATPSQKKTTEA